MKSWPRFAKAVRANPIPVATYMTGTVYVALGAVMGALGLADALLGEDARGFFVGAAIGLPLGWVLRRLGSPQAEPRRAEALLTVAGLWILVPILGAIPYWISGASATWTHSSRPPPASAPPGPPSWPTSRSSATGFFSGAA